MLEGYRRFIKGFVNCDIVFEKLLLKRLALPSRYIENEWTQTKVKPQFHFCWNVSVSCTLVSCSYSLFCVCGVQIFMMKAKDIRWRFIYANELLRTCTTELPLVICVRVHYTLRLTSHYNFRRTSKERKITSVGLGILFAFWSESLHFQGLAGELFARMFALPVNPRTLLTPLQWMVGMGSCCARAVLPNNKHNSVLMDFHCSSYGGRESDRKKKEGKKGLCR